MTIDKKLIDRINELAHKNKTVGLTDEEIEERAVLREKYLEAIRGQVRGHLSRVKFVEDLTEEEKAEYLAKKN